MDSSAPTDLHRDPSALRGSRIKVEDPPSWTIRRKVKNLDRVDGYPVTMLLLDRQIAPDKSQRYTRYVRRLETPQAVQESGRIEFDFDPATQRQLIHAISIFRNGELKNYAKLDQIEVIQREKDLEKGIYAGSITALVLLKDLRTGDVIDIESSIISEDDIFPSHYWFGENFQHTLPVGRQYFSWLSENHEKFQFSLHQDDIDTEVQEEETKWGLRKTWVRENDPAIDLPPVLPIGLNPFESISITSFASWAEVASEIANLWERTEKPGNNLHKELKKLKLEHSDSEIDLIEAIVAFVRDSIRYQGVEIGRLGLIPEDLDVIWERRFGDCKEKTSLLCWLLQQSGFDAQPALVSVALRGKIADELPAPIFDHVVVYLKHDDSDYWIDPTIISQRGSLLNWNSLPFQQALLISKKTTGFLDIADAPPNQDFVRVFESYNFNANNAVMTVSQEFHGAEADGIRSVLDSNGRTQIQKMFTEVVKSTRSEAELTTDLQISDDPEKNIIILGGEFTALNALRENPQTGRYICEFIPHAIISKIQGLDQSSRKFPLGLMHPTEVFHSIEVNHPNAKGAIVPKTIINNEFLEFKAGTENEKNCPTLSYYYRSKTGEVPVKDLHRYRMNLDQMSAAISLVFETGRNSGSKATKSNRNWQDEELDPSTRPRRTQHHSGDPHLRNSTTPIWPFIIGGVLLLKVILLIIRYIAAP